MNHSAIHHDIGWSPELLAPVPVVLAASLYGMVNVLGIEMRAVNFHCIGDGASVPETSVDSRSRDRSLRQVLSFVAESGQFRTMSP
jgi:hypothetical protein